MKLSPIVLKIRAANTMFSNRVAGAAELELAMTHTLKQDTAFVIPSLENAPASAYDGHINQKITETFAIVVGLANDSSDKERTGIVAYDLIHTARAQIWHAILGWDNPTEPNGEGLITYAGGRLLDINRAYLWYQFDFSFPIRIDSDDGIEDGTSDLPVFEDMYTQWVLGPDANLPIGESLPVNLFDPDFTQVIDFTVDPKATAYGSAFGFAFYNLKAQ